MEESLIIKNYTKDDDKNIVNLWNEEVGFIYPITENMFNQRICMCPYFNQSASFVAYSDNKLVGFILGKVYDNNPNIPRYLNHGWISLFYVSRKQRSHGIGKSLLDKCENKLRKLDVMDISIGADLNNFFPGIPDDFDNLSDGFFKNQSYNVGSYTHDLVKILNENDTNKYNDFYNETKLSEKYQIRYATCNDKEKVLAFFEKEFYGRWMQEAVDYFKDNDIFEEYLIVLDDEKVVGFLRVNKQKIYKLSYNIMWANRFPKLVGYGPLGVDKEYRKHGLASYLILYALNDCYLQGYSHALIDWTGLVTYYQKFGFETWKCYKYTNKSFY